MSRLCCGGSLTAQADPTRQPSGVASSNMLATDALHSANPGNTLETELWVCLAVTEPEVSSTRLCLDVRSSRHQDPATCSTLPGCAKVKLCGFRDRPVPKHASLTLREAELLVEAS
jgi:hypothetical protein